KYIENITLKGDMQIIFATFLKVIRRDGVVEEGSETATDLGDYLLNKGHISKIEYDNGQELARVIMNQSRFE
ncbi:MAG: hypothetical protein IKP62_01535, partial [Salinivirgaceae bacterium]|nr:hypothetical protein [Salinivirgaceae bacterium]